MDILVPIPMKNAAKCDTQCELQNVSHQIFERKWRRLAAGMWCSVCFGNHKRGMWLKAGRVHTHGVLFSPIKRALDNAPFSVFGSRLLFGRPPVLPASFGSSH